MTDGNWLGDTQPHQSRSSGLIRIGGATTQQTVALTSGGAAMNASVKAISEEIGVSELLKEVVGTSSKMVSKRTRARS